MLVTGVLSSSLVEPFIRKIFLPLERDASLERSYGGPLGANYLLVKVSAFARLDGAFHNKDSSYPQGRSGKPPG